MNASAEEPPFARVGIVGIGLIGGSIALAVRERWPSMRVVGMDTPAVLAHVAGSGAIDRAARALSELGDPDLVILAAPVRQNIALLAELPARVGAGTVITDVSGTKREIVSAAAAIHPPLTFVGGHPIGGAEQGGFAFARSDLFQGRPWILTSDLSGSSPHFDQAHERLQRFVRGLGARPSTMSAHDHDRVMAFISHLPQLAVSALMATAGDAVCAEGLRLSGRGLVDSTRLASSPADVWRDICATNAEPIAEALDLLIERLTRLRAGLTGGDPVEAIFAEAGRWRSELMKGLTPRDS